MAYGNEARLSAAEIEFSTAPSGYLSSKEAVMRNLAGYGIIPENCLTKPYVPNIQTLKVVYITFGLASKIIMKHQTVKLRQ